MTDSIMEGFVSDLLRLCDCPVPPQLVTQVLVNKYGIDFGAAKHTCLQLVRHSDDVDLNNDFNLVWVGRSDYENVHSSEG